MKRIRLLIYLFVMIVEVCHSQEASELEKLEFFLGEWNLTTSDLQPDGSFKVGKATSTVYYILDGGALQDDFRGYDQHGNISFRGTSIRSYSSEQSVYVVIWIMAGREGLTDIRPK